MLSLCGCDLDYWWSRGQPPSSTNLLFRSQKQLEENLSSTARADVKGEATQLRDALRDVHGDLSKGNGGARLQEGLAKVNTALSALEGKISWGSRAPYGELIRQLQGFRKEAAESGTVDKNVFSLYSARTLFFLASELSVDAPVAYQG